MARTRGSRNADAIAPGDEPRLVTPADFGIHSVVPAANGEVWFVETALGKIAKLDTKTKEFTEYQNPPLPDGRRTGAHTIRVDERGLVYVVDRFVGGLYILEMNV